MPATQAKTFKNQIVDPLTTERQAFMRQRTQLLRRYGGQFVAVYCGRVVDHDKDDEALANRMYARLGEVPFYIARVELEQTLYELPSPEVGR